MNNQKWNHTMNTLDAADEYIIANGLTFRIDRVEAVKLSLRVQDANGKMDIGAMFAACQEALDIAAGLR